MIIMIIISYDFFPSIYFFCLTGVRRAFPICMRIFHHYDSHTLNTHSYRIVKFLFTLEKHTYRIEYPGYGDYFHLTPIAYRKQSHNGTFSHSKCHAFTFLRNIKNYEKEKIFTPSPILFSVVSPHLPGSEGGSEHIEMDRNTPNEEWIEKNTRQAFWIARWIIIAWHSKSVNNVIQELPSLHYAR